MALHVTLPGDICMSPTREVPKPTSLSKPLAGVDPVYSLDLSVPKMPGKDPQDVFIDTNHIDTANAFTRTTEPRNPARIAILLDQIHIGPDLTLNEQLAVQQLVIEFADCFTLLMAKVIPVDNAIHRLNIPADATFSYKVRQRPLTPPQRPWFHKKLDEMLAAGIIAPCHPSKVKAVSLTTLAQKAHETGGLTLDEIRQLVNDQLIASRNPAAFTTTTNTPCLQTDSTLEQKWQICQNFTEVNNVTQVTPMPQGDIRAKQQHLSGHRWLLVFNFASGFYTCTVAEESRPYTAFYMEGRGYFWYCKMPFGLIGAPSTFAHMTAMHLHDLLTAEIMELFVNNGGTATNKFHVMMTNLHSIFQRIREWKLSLSASKTLLFQSEAIFTGATVGQKGVTPDLSKLTAIAEWPQPHDTLALS